MTEIPCTAAVRRFNRAVEEADRLSGYRFDRCSPGALVYWLVAAGHSDLAFELHTAALGAGCWQDYEHCALEPQ